VARDDDRDGVRRHGGAHGAAGLGVADHRGQLEVAHGAAVADLGEQALEHRAAEASGQLPVDRQVEVVAPALEVLVELAAGLVEPVGRLEHAGAHALGQVFEDRVAVLALEAEADDAGGRGGDEQRADRAVGGGVGDVDQLLGLGPGEGGGQVVGGIGGLAAQGGLEGVRAHRGVTSWRSAARPARTFWRAAASEQPSATPISA
jgi:hypothetical protein